MQELTIHGEAIAPSLEAALEAELFLQDNYLFRRNMLNGKIEFATLPAEVPVKYQDTSGTCHEGPGHRAPIIQQPPPLSGSPSQECISMLYVCYMFGQHITYVSPFVHRH